MTSHPQDRHSPDRHRTSLRPLGMPRALRVRTNNGDQPVGIARTDVHGRTVRELRVECVEETWRLAEAWWREIPQRRTYHRVHLEGGRMLTLFRDDTLGAWFEQSYTAPEGSRSGP